MGGHAGGELVAAEASAAGGEPVRWQDLEEGGGSEASQQAQRHGGGYGATPGGEPGARRRGNRRAVAAGLLLGVAAVAAVVMLGTGGSRAPGTGGSRAAGLVSLASLQELEGEGQEEGDPPLRTLPLGTGPNAPLTLSPEEDPEQVPGAMDVDAQTDMAPKGERIGFAMEEPGRSGGGLMYPRSANQFYDHMLFNANLSLQENKDWRYWSRIRVRDEVY